MNEQGGIVLGGDRGNTAQGISTGGIVTTGSATTATDEAVQANIVGAGTGAEETFDAKSTRG
jgi:hypothetical protein